MHHLGGYTFDVARNSSPHESFGVDALRHDGQDGWLGQSTPC